MKIRRNEPCPCGSGRKNKKCCSTKDETRERATRAAVAERSEPAEDAIGGIDTIFEQAIDRVRAYDKQRN